MATTRSQAVEAHLPGSRDWQPTQCPFLQDALSDCAAAVALTRRTVATRPPARSWSVLAPTIPALSTPTPSPTTATRDQQPSTPPPAANPYPQIPTPTPHSSAAALITDTPRDPRSSGTHATTANPSSSTKSAKPGESAAAVADAARTPVAVVFGREESGLTAGEAQQCTHACGIPTGRLQPSMNLSHAAAVILAQVYDRAVCAGSSVAGPDDPRSHHPAGGVEAGASNAADAAAGGPERGGGAIACPCEIAVKWL